MREVADGGTNSLTNLVGVCHECHAKVTARNASAKSRGARAGQPSGATAADRARAGDRSADRPQVPRTLFVATPRW
jgi:hypothetical protein